MPIIKRLIVPAGKNVASQEEYFDTDTKRVVPKPEERATASPRVAAIKVPASDARGKKAGS